MVKALKSKVQYGINAGFRHGFKNVIFSKFFFGFVTSLSVLLSSHDKAGRIKDNLDAKFNEQEDTFDFIVVGGGTAGSLVANRLSEKHKVLLLEAGGEPHPLQKIPGMALFLLNHPEIDWMHRTVPQRRACFASPHRRGSWSQGKNLGGSSNLNFMAHLRGSPRDFDHWAKLTGDETWEYEALLPYFRRHENYLGDSPDREAHGFDGEVKLACPSYTGMAKEFIRAGQELGYEHVDLNARYDEGFDTLFYPMEGGERRSAYSSFLDPIRDRETLVIRKFSHVNKLLIRKYDNTVYGVEYDRHGRKRYAYATKEVILSAGTVESAKLLMLSGIGPKTHLADMGIPLVSDLPVGRNLQDHLATFIGPFFIDPPRSYLIDRDITMKTFYEYKSDGTGPMSTSLFQAAGMISSKKNKWAGHWNWPDIQLFLSGLAGHKTFASDMAKAFHLSSKLIKKYYDHALGRDSFFIAVSPSRPYARGEIVLEKRDPYAPPSINPNYLRNDHDMGIMIEGIKTALYLVENTTSFQYLRARFTNKKFPGCEHMAFRSDDYFECYVRHFSVSLQNPIGSCAMGHPHMGKESVVDAELQVFGVKHLRVVDASVMPTIPGSPTEAAVLMIAEKGADMIEEAWRVRGKDEEVHPHRDEEEEGEGGPHQDPFIPHNLRENFRGPGWGDNNGNNAPPGNGPPGWNWNDVQGPQGQGWGNGPPPGWNGGPSGPDNGPPPGWGNNGNGPPGENGPPPNGWNGPPGNEKGPPPNGWNGPPGNDNGPPPNGPPPNGWNGPPGGENGPPPGQNRPLSGWDQRPGGPPSPAGNKGPGWNGPGPGSNGDSSNGPPNGWNANNGPPGQGPGPEIGPNPNGNGPPSGSGWNNNGPPPGWKGDPNGNNGPPSPNSNGNGPPGGWNNNFNGPPQNNGPPPGWSNNGNGNNGNGHWTNNGNGPGPGQGPPGGNSGWGQPGHGHGPPPPNFNNNPPGFNNSLNMPQGRFQNNTGNGNGPPPMGPNGPGSGPMNMFGNGPPPNQGPGPGPPFPMMNMNMNMNGPNPTQQTPDFTTQSSMNIPLSNNFLDQFPSRRNSSQGGNDGPPNPFFDSFSPTMKPSRLDDSEDMLAETTTIATTIAMAPAPGPSPTSPGIDMRNEGPSAFPNMLPNQAEEFVPQRPMTSSIEALNKIPGPLQMDPMPVNFPMNQVNNSSSMNLTQTQNSMSMPMDSNWNGSQNQTRTKVPSSATVPDIYYKIKDAASITNLEADLASLNEAQSSPSNQNQVKIKVNPGPGSTSSPYWTNPSTMRPANFLQYPQTPSPKKKKMMVVKSVLPNSQAFPKQGRVVRIKSGNIGVEVSSTAMPPTMEASPDENLLGAETRIGPGQSQGQSQNQIKIRIKHKNVAESGVQNHQNIEPYFSQGRSMDGNGKTTSIFIKKKKSGKPQVFEEAPITSTRRPLLSVTIWPENNNSRNSPTRSKVSTVSKAQSPAKRFQNFKDFSPGKNGTMRDSQASGTFILGALAEATLDAIQDTLVGDDDADNEKERDYEYVDGLGKSSDSLPLSSGNFGTNVSVPVPNHNHDGQINHVPPPSVNQGPPRPPWTPSYSLESTTNYPFSNVIRSVYNWNDGNGNSSVTPANHPAPTQRPTSLHPVEKDSVTEMSMTSFSFAPSRKNARRNKHGGRRAPLSHVNKVRGHKYQQERPTTTHKPMILQDIHHPQQEQDASQSQPLPHNYRKSFESFFKPRREHGRSFKHDRMNISEVLGYDVGQDLSHQIPEELNRLPLYENENEGNWNVTTENPGQYPDFLETFNTPGGGTVRPMNLEEIALTQNQNQENGERQHGFNFTQDVSNVGIQRDFAATATPQPPQLQDNLNNFFNGNGNGFDNSNNFNHPQTHPNFAFAETPPEENFNVHPDNLQPQVAVFNPNQHNHNQNQNPNEGVNDAFYQDNFDFPQNQGPQGFPTPQPNFQNQAQNFNQQQHQTQHQGIQNHPSPSPSPQPESLPLAGNSAEQAAIAFHERPRPNDNDNDQQVDNNPASQDLDQLIHNLENQLQNGQTVDEGHLHLLRESLILALQKEREGSHPHQQNIGTGYSPSPISEILAGSNGDVQRPHSRPNITHAQGYENGNRDRDSVRSNNNNNSPFKGGQNNFTFNGAYAITPRPRPISSSTPQPENENQDSRFSNNPQQIQAPMRQSDYVMEFHTAEHNANAPTDYNAGLRHESNARVPSFPQNSQHAPGNHEGLNSAHNQQSQNSSQFPQEKLVPPEDPSRQEGYLPPSPPSSPMNPDPVDPDQISITFDHTGSTSMLDQPVLSNGDVVPLNGSGIDAYQVSLTEENRNQNPNHPSATPTPFHLHEAVHPDTANHNGRPDDSVKLSPPLEHSTEPSGYKTINSEPEASVFDHAFPTFPPPPFISTTPSPAIFGSRIPNLRARDPFHLFGDSFTTTENQWVVDHFHEEGGFGLGYGPPIYATTASPHFSGNSEHHFSTPLPGLSGTVSYPEFGGNHVTTVGPFAREFNSKQHQAVLPEPTGTPRPEPKEYTIYSNPDTVDITTNRPEIATENSTYFFKRSEVDVSGEDATSSAEDFDKTEQEKEEKMSQRRVNHMRRRGDILRRRRNRRKYWSRNERFEDSAASSEEHRPFRRRNRRPHSRRRLREEIENYPFEEKVAAQNSTVSGSPNASLSPSTESNKTTNASKAVEKTLRSQRLKSSQLIPRKMMMKRFLHVNTTELPMTGLTTENETALNPSEKTTAT